MDETFFFFGTVLALGLPLLGLAMSKGHDFAPAYAFFGGLIGILTTTSANTDGSITVAYNSNQTIGLWPALYFPIIFTVLAFFAAIYIVADKRGLL